MDADHFSLQPLERSPGSGHYLSAHWPPCSSKPRVLAASWGPRPAAGTPSCRAVTSVDDDPVAQLSVATVGCRGNTMMAGHCLVPACCLSCLAQAFQGPEVDPRASSPELLGFCSVPGLGCGGGDGAAGMPALSSCWGLQPGRTR